MTHECTTHHYACDCREAEHQFQIEKRDRELEAAKQRELELLAVIEKVRDFISNAQVSSGVCCCGDSMESHYLGSGHSPVDMWDNAVAGLLESTQEPSQALREYEAKVLEEADKDAARDLMIKELREESKDYMLAISVLFAIQAEGDCLAERKPSKDIHTYNAFIYLSTQGKRLSEALANSEHHNFRALDKMLLEAEIKAMESMINPATSINSHDIYMNKKAKLAELNKE